MSGERLRADFPKAAPMARNAAMDTSCPPWLEPNQDVMNGETFQCKVVVTDPQGFHMRPLTVFTQLAGKFQSKVTVTKDTQRVNGKSPLELLCLGATQGTELILEVSGSDAREALEALTDLLLHMGDEPPEPSVPPKG